MKRIKIFVLALLSAFVFALSGCDVVIRMGMDVTVEYKPFVKEKMTQVSNLEMSSEGILSFSPVNRAAGYRLELNGFEMTTVFVAVNVKTIAGFRLPSDGIFQVSVVTLPKYADEYEESDPYTAQLVVGGVKLDTPKVKLTGKNMIAVEYSSAALGIKLKVNQFVFDAEDLTDNRLNLTSVTTLNGNYEIALTEIGDGVYLKDSDTVKYLYSYNGDKFEMPKVQNARMEGLTFKFDKIDNAYTYVICDVLNNFYEVRTNEVDLTEKTMVRSVKAKYISSEVDPGEEQTEIKYFARGQGTQDSPYQIDSYESMRYIEYYERQGIAKHYKLTRDIAFPDVSLAALEEGGNYMEIGSLCGVLDGGGFALKNIVLANSRGFVGLFDTVSQSGVVKNLIVDGFELRTWRVLNGDGNVLPSGGSIGVICKENYGRIENLTVKNSLLKAEGDDVSAVSFNRGVMKDVYFEGNEIISGAEGGLIAVINSGRIETSSIGVNQYTAVKNIAAVCALNFGIIDDCDNNTPLNFEGADEVGGIVSWNEGTVIRCDNNAAITGNTFVGGIVGKNGGRIESCTNSGEITGSYGVGGICGQTEKLASSIVEAYVGKISKCINTGKINSTDFSGGISGKNTNGFIELSVNRGNVESANTAGGISGSCGIMGADNYWLNAGIYRSYNTGVVKGKISGGIAGENSSWRYDTATTPYTLKEGYGVYNCYSVGGKTVGINNNQVCDSFSDVALAKGTFLIAGKTVTLAQSAMTLTDMKKPAFTDKLNASIGCAGIWESTSGYPALVWEKSAAVTGRRNRTL